MSVVAASGQMDFGSPSIRAYLSGTCELPPNNSSYTAVATLSWSATNSSQVTCRVYFPPEFCPTGAGIYGPAGPAQRAPHLFDLGQLTVVEDVICVGSWENGLICVTNAHLAYSNIFVLTPQQLADLNLGLWYVNITSAEYPGGEIRGQISDQPVLSQPRVLGTQSHYGLVLDVTTPPMRDYAVDVSPDLINWSTVVSVHATNSMTEYIDSEPTGYPRRFYRARYPNAIPPLIAGDAFLGQTGPPLFFPYVHDYFIVLPSDSGTNYQLIGIDGIADSSGTYSYTSTGGVVYLTFNSSNVLTSMQLGFQNISGGTYGGTISEPSNSTPGGTNVYIPVGSFQILSGQAVASVAGLTLYLSPQLSQFITYPPPTNAPAIFKISTSGENYTLDSPATNPPQHSTGTCSYSVLNRSTGSIRLNDSVLGASLMYLCFSDSSGGSYVISQLHSNVVQIGKFTIPPPPRFIELTGQLDFGSAMVGELIQRSLMITNPSGFPLIVSGINYPPGFSGDWSGIIPPHGSQSVPVTFYPKAQARYGGEASVRSDATIGVGTLAISGSGYHPITNAWNLWWQHTNGAIATWTMAGTNATLMSPVNPPNPGAGWTVLAAASIHQGVQTELFFESAAGRVATWLVNGTNRQSAADLTPDQVDPAWQIVATGDLNNDGQTDILWRRSDGAIGTWLMNGLVPIQKVSLNPDWADPAWKLAGTGDFNGDGQTDLLWQNADGRLAVWFMNSTNRLGTAYLNPDKVNPDWRVVGVMDFNGDGHPGLLWRQDSGGLGYWQMDGTNCVHGGLFNPAMADPAWRIVGPR